MVETIQAMIAEILEMPLPLLIPIMILAVMVPMMAVAMIAEAIRGVRISRSASRMGTTND
ncbi:MAG: hypothetical protein PVH25_08990 [Burkholderiales bacterium]